VAYFVAVLARHGEDWEAHDVDVDDVDDLGSLAELLRSVATDEEPVLLVLEREDEWFAMVRVDGEDDPRVFVSDAAAVSSTPYAEVLGVETTDEELADEPVGDFDILADLGIPPDQLRGLCDGELAATPAEALAVIGETAGFDDVLESLR
jgi:putative tRNA adenosine deaminase-associated protein